MSTGAVLFQVADPALVARVIAEAKVDETVPQVGWSAYVTHLVQELTGRLFSYLGERLVGLLEMEGFWQVVFWLLLVVGAVAALVVLVRLLRRQRSPAVVTAAVTTPTAAPQPAAAVSWRAELERRLAAGEVAASLEAAWWWLASSLLGPEVDPAWTSRELVERADRRDLAREVGRLDRFLYGPHPPQVAEIAEWASGMDRRLAR